MPWTFSVTISAGSHRIVHIDRFSIQPGKINILLGESGIGKSLIARSLFGLADQTRLDVTVNGIPYHQFCQSAQTSVFRQKGFFVFQEPSTHLNPAMTIADQLREADLASIAGEEEVLSNLWRSDGWKSLLPLYPQSYRPSGGEKQRFLLAMALQKAKPLQEGSHPDSLFVFDEPTGSLDNGFRNAFIHELIRSYERYRFTTLLITHDYTLIPFIQEQGWLPHVQFHELSRQPDGSVLQSEFDTAGYSGWQQSLQPLKQSSGNPFLFLESGLVVHGRRLRFSDEAGTPVALQLLPGHLTYLKAASGMGKTTIARVILGLYRATNLNLTIGPHRIHESTTPGFWKQELWGKTISMAFQLADEALNQAATVGQVFFALRNPALATSDQVRTFLQSAFINQIDPAFLNQKVRFLSGGQKQRLNLMRSMAAAPRVLILDEPLNGVDFRTIQLFISLLTTALKNQTAVLLISHNEAIFDRLTGPEDRIFLTADSV